MFCSKCGRQNPDGSKFCFVCGTKFMPMIVPENAGMPVNYGARPSPAPQQQFENEPQQHYSQYYLQQQAAMQQQQAQQAAYNHSAVAKKNNVPLIVTTAAAPKNSRAR